MGEVWGQVGELVRVRVRFELIAVPMVGRWDWTGGGGDVK